MKNTDSDLCRNSRLNNIFSHECPERQPQGCTCWPPPSCKGRCNNKCCYVHWCFHPRIFLCFSLLEFNTLEEDEGTESGSNHLELENKSRLYLGGLEFPRNCLLQIIQSCLLDSFLQLPWLVWFLTRLHHCSHCKWSCLFLLYAVISSDSCQRLLAWKNCF